MQRLNDIDFLTVELERRLEGEWRELALSHEGDGLAFGRRWRRRVEQYGYQEVNDLVDRHNTFFPAEARLPMDVRRRDYVLINGKSYRRSRVGPDWALARFPPDLAAASR